MYSQSHRELKRTDSFSCEQEQRPDLSTATLRVEVNWALALRLSRARACVQTRVSRERLHTRAVAADVVRRTAMPHRFF